MRDIAVVLVWLMAGATTACAGAGEGQADGLGAGAAQQALWSPSATGPFWPNGTVKVCWDHALMINRPFTSTWRSYVEQWVTTEISPFAKIDFTGFAMCPSSPGPEYLQLTTDTALLIAANPSYETLNGTQAFNIGYQPTAGHNGIFFTAPKDKATVLHEFMHALGYQHEKERTGTCTGPDASNPSQGKWSAFDPYSIMDSTGYCQGLKALSAWDRASIGREDNYKSRNRGTFSAALSGVEADPSWTPWVSVVTRANPGGGTSLAISDILVGNFVDEVGWGEDPSCQSTATCPLEDWTSDDLLATTGAGGWWVSSKGYMPWVKVADSAIGAASLLVGDFDGDGISDLLRPLGNVWKVSWSANSSWTTLNTLATSVPKSAMLIGKFDNDEKDDVLWVEGGGSEPCSPACNWYLSSGGSRPLQLVNSSAAPVVDLKIGRMDRWGRDDVLYADGFNWLYSSSATRAWVALNKSSVKGRDLLVGNFDGLGHDDVFMVMNGKFKVSYEGTGVPVDVATSDITIGNLRVANFGLGRTEGNALPKASVFRN